MLMLNQTLIIFNGKHFIPGKFHVGVEGLEEAVTSLAGCCKPVPGDEIIGYISKNRMIKIHRKNCESASHIGNDQTMLHYLF